MAKYRKPLSKVEMKIIAFNLKKRGCSQEEINTHLNELVKTAISNHQTPKEKKASLKEEFNKLTNQTFHKRLSSNQPKPRLGSRKE